MENDKQTVWTWNKINLHETKQNNLTKSQKDQSYFLRQAIAIIFEIREELHECMYSMYTCKDESMCQVYAVVRNMISTEDRQPDGFQQAHALITNIVTLWNAYGCWGSMFHIFPS